MSDNGDNEPTEVVSSEKRELIVILDLASLETVKTKKGDYQLLNCDDHLGVMEKLSRDPQKICSYIYSQDLKFKTRSEAGHRHTAHKDKNTLKMKMLFHLDTNPLIRRKMIQRP
jgi:hypothetical protein